MKGYPALLAIAVLLASAAAQQDETSSQRCRALAVAQDAGTFDVAAAVAALADPDEAVARTAAAIVRHEWRELPDALFLGLDAAPRGARMLLQELAQAPRPAAAPWAQRHAAEAVGRSLDDRCLALASRGTPLVAAEVDVLLRTLLQGEADDGFRAALVVVPSRLVDATVGRVHQALQQGTLDVERVVPWLDRLSARGVQSLLGLVLTLPEPVARTLCRHVHERDPAAVHAHVQLALDGDGPIDAVWLSFAGACLDRPARVQRLERLLADAELPAGQRDLARRALVEARQVSTVLLDEVEADGAQRSSSAVRLLDVAIDRLPAARLCRWLETDLAEPTARALLRRARLEPELEQVLVDQLLGLGTAEGKLGQPLAAALVQNGGAAALQRVWPLLRASPRWPEFLDALGRRRAPFVHELLLTELQTKVDDVAPDVRTAWLDAVALALVALGDRRELQRLVDGAPRASANDVRRRAHHVRPLGAREALQLLAAVPSVADVDAAAELLGWAATAVDDPAVRARLLAMWQGPAVTLEAAELREVALRALAGSPYRDTLRDELRTALAKGPLPDDLEPLPYALLASMPMPAADEDLALCADLVLVAPRTDPAREAAASERWPDGSFGFPLVAAVAEKLRAVEPARVEAAFAAAATAALADPRHVGIARQRLLVLWRELAVVPAVQQAAGIATAALALAVGGPVDSDGPAHLYAAAAASQRGEPALARHHAEQAVRGLLRLPEQRRAARIFLGERDPAAGNDPWAALAARPHLYAWQQATAAGEAAAAAAALAQVREFAGHDDALLATVSKSTPESVR